MQDLMNDLQRYSNELDQSVKRFRKNGEALAQAERDYKVLLRQEVLKLRDEGMAVGLIDKTVYGLPSVADARFRRDVAEAMYKANQEHINTTKLHLRIIESQISREWGNGNS